jgi:hypothetical protein
VASLQRTADHPSLGIGKHGFQAFHCSSTHAKFQKAAVVLAEKTRAIAVVAEQGRVQKSLKEKKLEILQIWILTPHWPLASFGALQ